MPRRLSAPFVQLPGKKKKFVLFVQQHHDTARVILTLINLQSLLSYLIYIPLKMAFKRDRLLPLLPLSAESLAFFRKYSFHIEEEARAIG